MKAHPAACAGALALLFFLIPSCATAPAPQQVATITLVNSVDPWPRPKVLKLAMEAYECGRHEGRIQRPLLTIIDYSLPSKEPRLWVIDVRRNRLLYRELVAHGAGSGGAVAVKFSNQLGSHESSLGLFRTDNTYRGRFGYSLRLSGLEPGFNDNAYERAIVMHGSSDVSRAFARKWGMVGQSWGCPALPKNVAPQIINTIAGGSAVFAYYPDTEWLQESHYLHCGVQVAGASAN